MNTKREEDAFMVFAPAGINVILEIGAVLFVAPKVLEAAETASKIMDSTKESDKKEEPEKK